MTDRKYSMEDLVVAVNNYSWALGELKKTEGYLDAKRREAEGFQKQLEAEWQKVKQQEVIVKKIMREIMGNE